MTEYEKMKKILLFAFVSLLLIGCKPYEQQRAEAFIKQHMKCPSSLKVISFSSMYMDESVSMDTSYHVYRINDRARTVSIDSAKQTKRTYPAHYRCFVTFDAQNPMGAMIRYSEQVVVQDGRGWWWDDWFSYHYNHATDSVWPEKGTKQIKPSQFLYGTRWYNNDYFMD